MGKDDAAPAKQRIPAGKHAQQRGLVLSQDSFLAREEPATSGCALVVEKALATFFKNVSLPSQRLPYHF